MDYKDKYIQLLEELLTVYKNRLNDIEKVMSKISEKSHNKMIYYDLNKVCTCPKGNCCTDVTCSYKEFGEPKGY